MVRAPKTRTASTAIGHLAEVQEDSELIEFTTPEDYRLKTNHLARISERESDR